MCKFKSGAKEVSITGWNVNGIFQNTSGAKVNKLDDEYFSNIMKSDIVFLSETHLHSNQTLAYDGFKCYTNRRPSESNKSRGGLAVFIKRTILCGVSLIDKSLSEMMWFKLDKHFFNLDKDLFICFPYLVPPNSTYAKRTGIDKQVLSKLEEDVIKYGNLGNIMIIGDLNAHINENDQDYIVYDSDNILDDFVPANYVADSVHICRNTLVNQNTNSYGKSILELCTDSQLRILNGRTLGDSVGKPTFFNYNGVTINDYCICSSSFLKHIVNFQVNDFVPTLSDHCPITVKLLTRFCNNSPDMALNPNYVVEKWTKLTEERFISNLAKININNINMDIKSTKEKILNGTLNDEEKIQAVDNIVNEFSNDLRKSAFGTKISLDRKKKTQKKKNKPWHDIDCKAQLKHVKQLGRVLSKSPWDKNLRIKVLQAKKEYNKLMRKKFRAYKAKLLKSMVDMSDKNPNEFWKIYNILNNKATDDPSTNVAPHEWHKYFKSLMNKDYKNHFQEVGEDNVKQYISSSLNVDITAKELFKAVKSLKNNKSCGPDNIYNEMIKHSCPLFHDLYVDIFNIILNSSVYPSIWRNNYIKPLFKGGCVNDPSCYRGISISSCFSKLFTRILFNRLDKYLEDNSIICPEQIGFRKGARTSDHIFSLKTLIDKFFKKKKYLFTCFVDLKKAFDTVNRKALLHKIYSYDIRGNFYRIMESMYRNVYFSVKVPDGLTDSFDSSIGVKQGCVLSPTIFSLYVNDLVKHFNSDDDQVDLNGKSISCLLYADDLVLISQTANGLQKLLDKLKTYCDMWNLKVNTDKTKVIIFNKSGKLLKGFSFSYETQLIELVTEYKYLGIIFKASGSFTYASSILSKKASKAMFCMLKTLDSENINIASHVKLFETCVKPILLYCCEIWSLDSLIKGNKEINFKIDHFIPNKLLLKFSKFTLGVQKTATNIAVLGELGLFPLALDAMKSTIGFWLHLLEAKSETLIYHSYEENKNMSNSLCNKIRICLIENGFEHVWTNQSTFSKNKLLFSFKKILEKKFISYWEHLLHSNKSQQNKQKDMGNKLRTYSKLKAQFIREKYLYSDVDKKTIVSFIKIRISNSILEVERGRFNRIPFEERICKLCSSEVEDEFHFLMKCSALQNQRDVFFNNVTSVVPSFSNLNDVEKFKFILTSNDLDICKINIEGVHSLYQTNKSVKETHNC